MIFNPKKGGGHFLAPLAPLQTPRVPQKLQKVGFKWGGGGSGTKNSIGDAFIRQNNDLQGVNLTNRPLGVRYTNRPKKTKMGGGGMWRSNLYTCAWF